MCVYFLPLEGTLTFFCDSCLHLLTLACKVTANVLPAFLYPALLQFFAFCSRGQEALYSLAQQFREIKYKRRATAMEDGVINRRERPGVCFVCLCKCIAIIVFHDPHSAELTQSF